jgi:hypothetical protein
MKNNVYKGKPSFGKYVISKNVDGLVTDMWKGGFFNPPFVVLLSCFEWLATSVVTCFCARVTSSYFNCIFCAVVSFFSVVFASVNCAANRIIFGFHFLLPPENFEWDVISFLVYTEN